MRVYLVGIIDTSLQLLTINYQLFLQLFLRPKILRPHGRRLDIHYLRYFFKAEFVDKMKVDDHSIAGRKRIYFLFYHLEGENLLFIIIANVFSLITYFSKERCFSIFTEPVDAFINQGD